MRNLIFAAAFAAIGTFPAAAAGCGMMEQAAAKEVTKDAPAAGGMMCEAAKTAAPQSTPGQSPQAAGGCPCCAKMASMKMPEAKEDPMPGMEMPATPPAPGQ
jgi:hypothetical protein